MDNKVTKKRLSDFFMYNWITLICVILVVVFFWELIYMMLAVRLNKGQQFVYFYDENVCYVNEDGFEKILSDRDTFSYDVIEKGYDILLAEYNTLSARLAVSDGDAIFTDDYRGEDEKGLSRARTIVDLEKVATFDKLLNDGITYLTKFIKDEHNNLIEQEKKEIALDYKGFAQNYDIQKITQNFLDRYSKDNRFRKQEERQKGIENEIKRIERLSKELSDFNYLLLQNDELFFRYTRYTQSRETVSAGYLVDYDKKIQTEIDEGRENAIYGLNLVALTGGVKQTKDFFKLINFSSSKHVVLMAFDFVLEQPDLQFETVSFINTVIRAFSDIYDGR